MTNHYTLTEPQARCVQGIKPAGLSIAHAPAPSPLTGCQLQLALQPRRLLLALALDAAEEQGGQAGRRNVGWPCPEPSTA